MKDAAVYPFGEVLQALRHQADVSILRAQELTTYGNYERWESGQTRSVPTTSTTSARPSVQATICGSWCTPGWSTASSRSLVASRSTSVMPSFVGSFPACLSVRSTSASTPTWPSSSYAYRRGRGRRHRPVRMRLRRRSAAGLGGDGADHGTYCVVRCSGARSPVRRRVGRHFPLRGSHVPPRRLEGVAGRAAAPGAPLHLADAQRARAPDTPGGRRRPATGGPEAGSRLAGDGGSARLTTGPTAGLPAAGGPPTTIGGGRGSAGQRRGRQGHNSPSRSG